MLKNAFAYVTRKSLKSLIILLIILSMSALSLISLSIKLLIPDMWIILLRELTVLPTWMTT